MLADDDSEFRSRFSMYLIENLNDISLTACDSRIDTVEKSERFDMVISDENSKAKVVKLMEESGFSRKVAYLVKDIKAADDGNSNIYRYQPAKMILQKIMAIADSYDDNAVIGDFGGFSDITADNVYICGLSGGCGKTTVSIIFARIAALYFGRKVLVIGTDKNTDLKYYFREKNDINQCDIDILLMNFIRGIKTDLTKYLLQDDTGVSCLRCSTRGFTGISELDFRKFKDFLSYLCESNLFDLIVVDFQDITGDIFRQLSDSREKIVTVKDIRRINHIVSVDSMHSDGYMDDVNAFVVVENFCQKRDKKPVFISEEDIAEEEYIASNQDMVRFYISPESFQTQDNHMEINLSDELSQSGVSLYRKLFISGGNS